MSKGLNTCFAVAVIVSCLLSLLSLWIARELNEFYRELLGGADMPSPGKLTLRYGHWVFLGHAFSVGLGWLWLQRMRVDAEKALYLLMGLTGVQMALVVLAWVGSVLVLLMITTQLGSMG